MELTKQKYILKCLRKISHKEWESFVITRILHGLDDDEIEFVTQQLIRKADGQKQVSEAARHPGRKHIVFAKARDVLGFNLLRYVGSFKLNFNRSTEDCLIFDRVSEQEAVRT